MKAEDTVMSDGEIIKRAGKGDKSRQYCYKAIAKIQAEISFKAGWEAHKKVAKEQIEAHGDICYKAGIKEVVGWIGKRKKVDEYGNSYIILAYNIASKGAKPLLTDDWQAKLKEWGIK